MTFILTSANRSSSGASGSFTVCGGDQVDVPISFTPSDSDAVLGDPLGGVSGCGSLSDTVNSSVVTDSFGRSFLRISWVVARPRNLTWSAVP